MTFALLIKMLSPTFALLIKMLHPTFALLIKMLHPIFALPFSLVSLRRQKKTAAVPSFV